MPKGIVLFKERTLRRAIRAVQKEGLVPKARVHFPYSDGRDKQRAL